MAILHSHGLVLGHPNSLDRTHTNSKKAQHPNNKTMKLAGDLLCTSLRIIDAVVATLPSVSIICSGGAVPADKKNETNNVIDNNSKKDEKQSPAGPVAFFLLGAQLLLDMMWLHS